MMKKNALQTTPGDKVTYAEKVATCHSDGRLCLASHAPAEAIEKRQRETGYTEDGLDKLEASLRFADSCMQHGDYSQALDYYSYVLERSVSDGSVLASCQTLSAKAYKGIALCHALGDECTWECASEILQGYRKVVIGKED